MKAGQNQASRLVALAEEAGAELFTSPSGQTFATLDLGDHRETWPLHSQAFKTWLARGYWQRDGSVPNAQALQDALGVLDGKARYAGPIYEVATRLAGHEGAIYIDLADDHWNAIEITKDGWRVIADPPVRFRRPPGVQPLPMPLRGGSVEELWQFVNVAPGDDRRLVAGFLLGAFRPSGPKSVLGLHGIHGSAKSSAARFLRGLVDPSSAPLRAAPRTEHDLAIAAQNGWLIVLDNVSGLSQWMSDALCRISTGGGLATRTLYTTAEETIFQATRPIVITGIEDVASSSDLLDRSIVLHLPEIPESRRRDEERLSAEFEAARPRILGALLDAVAAGLRNLDTVEIAHAPRMADFARWVVACEPALGWPAGSFLAAYTGNRAQAHELAFEADIIGEPLRALAETGFEGTATNLLTALTNSVNEKTAKAKEWPQTARDLAGRVRRLTPNLRGVGLEVYLPDKNARPRLYRIRPRNTVATVATVADGRVPDDPRAIIDAPEPALEAGSDVLDDSDGLLRPDSENGSPEQTTFEIDPGDVEEWAERAREAQADFRGDGAGALDLLRRGES